MIIKNIIEFLKNEEQVFINDVGLFKKQYQPANIVGDHILPPCFKLLLEESKTGNGFAFILFVSKQEKLRIVDADMLIKTWIDELKKKISDSGTSYFEGFGTFSKDNEQLIFKSEYIQELNVDFEGMSSIQLPDLSITKEKIAETAPTLSPLADVENQEHIENVEKDVGKPETKVHFRQKKRIKIWSLLLFIFTIILTIAFLILLFFDVIELKFQEFQWKKALKQEEMLIVTDSLDILPTEQIVKDTIVIDSLEVQQEIVSNEESLVENLPISPEKVANFDKIHFISGKFYLIAGSFDTERKAIEHATYKQKQGLSPQLLFQENTHKIRICIGIFDNEESAMKAIPKGSNYWVLQ